MKIKGHNYFGRLQLTAMVVPGAGETKNLPNSLDAEH
jgi:hypothetical protein